MNIMTSIKFSWKKFKSSDFGLRWAPPYLMLSSTQSAALSLGVVGWFLKMRDAFSAFSLYLHGKMRQYANYYAFKGNVGNKSRLSFEAVVSINTV